MSARYITTTLPYVNAAPHVGHALEFVEADCYKRACVLAGEEAFLNIGTDEHGAKIAEKASEAGLTPQAYVDEYAARFKAFADTLNISYDAFTRTTNSTHIASAQEFWNRCDDKGDIYKAAYEVKYCVGCELEKTDSELVDGKCPLHPNHEIEIRTEENYYFKFSRYEQALLDLYEKNETFVLPKERLHEIRTFVKNGLKDFSISRRKEKLSWGIPVPGDDEHVMYVWFDALVNYISVIGWPTDEATFAKWWPVTQLAGKDNLRQQSAMWQAMLLSAGVAPSAQIFIHGFITSGGQKMSKSLGNVIDPMALVEKYGTDAVRYILLRHVSPFEDSDLTPSAIHDHYTAHLTNGLGNLVARVMKLAETHLSEPIERPADSPFPQEYWDLLHAFEFNRVADYIWGRIQDLDERITREEPFKVVKTDLEKGRALIREMVTELYQIGRLLNPFMPATNELIKQTILENKKPENLFSRLDA
ncbi:methionine--tRNA ligase [Candidatus Kaiserbacteria bacterium CG10_big_fil_rev_8_21_14_0_10_56_12]|uniref:Methionine--tRNA ligase n=1 Tax=Candidatus Kaiserbacteria bacterium CG10_big_fil_rev_8_21_14_0_10_56_12 TaxID=1974611 RepID=A0A2H0U9K1_9BACT|nr:MAG: methionine--tRNA ligase [Candidatus Kaiserbacteria bacterium CG10_big_fil_rev_8_21_14_0_10_56_12]